MDEDVHDFANNQPEVPRQSYPRAEAPMRSNGSGPKAFPALSQRQGVPVPSTFGWDRK